MSGTGFDYTNATLFEKMKWGERLGAFDCRLGRTLVRAFKLGVEDKVICRLVDDLLRPHVKNLALDRLPPFRAACLERGELVLGRDVHGRRVLLPARHLTSGVLFAGSSGCGKSNLLAFELLQLAALNYRFWVSENYKAEFRQLLPVLRRVGIALVVLTPKNWRWNPLQAHNVSPRLHLIAAVDLLVRLLGLGDRARAILSQAAHDLYLRFGIWEGQTRRWPTLFCLYEWVWARSQLNAAARESVLDRLGSLLVALTPRCAAYYSAWDPDALSRFSVVFEMRGASEIVKDLLLVSLVRAKFQQEVERGVFNGPLQLSIAVDDSQRVFQARTGDSGEIAPLDELAGIIRGTGLSLWAVLQMLQGVSRQLTPNLATKIMGRLGSHEDYARLGADMAMTAEQIDWAKRHLRAGMFIGQVGDGDYREPFAFTVPKVDLPETPTEAEVAASVRPLHQLPTEFADVYADWQPRHFAEVAPRPTEARTETPAAGAESLLSESDWRYLAAVAKETGRSATYYTRVLRLNGRRGGEIREQLKAWGLIRETVVPTAGSARESRGLELTPEGQAALRRHEAGGAS